MVFVKLCVLLVEFFRIEIFYQLCDKEISYIVTLTG